MSQLDNSELIAPLLRAALKSLNLQLEEELARYQQRRTERSPDAVLLASIEDEELPSEASNQNAANVSDYFAELVSLIPQDNLSPSPPQSPPDSSLDFEASVQALVQLASTHQKTNRLFTPLGIGSIFLALVASVLLGTALIAPYLRIGLGRSDQDSDQKLSDELFSLEESNDNLSSNQDSASASPPSSSVVPADAQPDGSQEYSDLASALLPPSLRPQMQPQNASLTETSPILKSATQLPDVPIDANKYYVLVEYSSQAALQQAQSAVKDAQLKKFPQGVRIQMGAFDEQKAANQLVERLKQQGIPASIYHPR